MKKQIGDKFISKHRSGSVPRNAEVTITNIMHVDGTTLICIDVGAYAIYEEKFDKLFDKPGKRDLTYEVDDKSELYLRQFIETTDEIMGKLAKHAKKYDIKNPSICAHYKDWEDFCSDWCDNCGYTRAEAKKLLHGGIGEFMLLPHSLGIVRFAF